MAGFVAARLTRGTGRLALVALVAAAATPGIAQMDDAALTEARQLFTNACATCHTAGKGEPNRQGPNLHGVVGRKAGTVPGFAYSSALKDADLVWDEASLDPWLENAQGFRKGTIMVYRQRDPERRAKLIAYLKTLKDNP